jgi:hypothetical protein
MDETNELSRVCKAEIPGHPSKPINSIRCFRNPRFSEQILIRTRTRVQGRDDGRSGISVTRPSVGDLSEMVISAWTCRFYEKKEEQATRFNCLDLVLLNNVLPAS